MPNIHTLYEGTTKQNERFGRNLSSNCDIYPQRPRQFFNRINLFDVNYVNLDFVLQ